jgi:glycine/D-amino acid oxidase-like deaminating enzyme
VTSTAAPGIRAAAVKSLADARPAAYWLEQPGAPGRAPALSGAESADLAIVGAGFTGLWTALLARERDPAADIVVLEARTAGWAASGRNGGFCSASLTHGLANGISRFPAEIARLEELGRENLAEIEISLRRYGIDCGFERSGELAVATAAWQLDGLAETAAAAREYGERVTVLDAAQVRAELASPTYLGGAWHQDTCAILDPARLAWGLRRACLDAGVRVYEGTPVRAVGAAGDGAVDGAAGDGGAGAGVRTGARAGLRLTTPGGSVRAARVALATGAYRPLLRRLRHYLVPVYDYALMTEPLSAGQLASIGWRHRQGVGDTASQFHYYRLTQDNRILWGGYDAVYYNGGRITAARDQRPETHRLLAEQFFETFPQLEGLAFTHKWGGVIDTCSRFCAFFGTAHQGRLGYAAGYTGLGVGASRFGANVMLDLLGGEPTERTALQMVRTRPVPFPPEPVRSAVIQLTRASIARADRNEGRRNLWLRALDRLGLGFDS